VVAPVALAVMASVPRVDLRELPARGVPCIRLALSLVVDLREHVPASVSAPAWERVPASARVLAPAAHQDFYRLAAVRLRVRSVRAPTPAVAVNSIRRPKKAR
jgi:hypothetical protein